MCRRNHLVALLMIAFGAGLLTGLCLESGFFSGCIGFGAVALGLFLMQRK